MSILSEKSYFTYSTVPQDDRNVESGYKTAFDYKSIFSYDSAFKDKDGNGQNSVADGKNLEDIAPEGLSAKIIAILALAFSYLFIFFTLPVTVWFCFKNLPQWERIVIYRLGKLIGVKGPGNVFLIPWLDCSTKLDLRTQVICHPLKQVLLLNRFPEFLLVVDNSEFLSVHSCKQFLTKDQAIVEAACSVFYRIDDPVRYISNVKDPELKGLKILANAIVMKRLEAADAREFQAARKAIIEERILKELNSITTAWGIEISSAHMY